MGETLRKRRWILLLAALCALVCLLPVWLTAQPDVVPAPSAEPIEDTDPLGMVLIDIQTEDTALLYHVKEYGVYVLAVADGSDAYRAGVCSGDRILTANGMKVTASAQLTELLTAAPALELTLTRADETIALRVEPSFD